MGSMPRPRANLKSLLATCLLRSRPIRANSDGRRATDNSSFNSCQPIALLCEAALGRSPKHLLTYSNVVSSGPCVKQRVIAPDFTNCGGVEGSLEMFR